jgi:hypothetical protein
MNEWLGSLALVLLPAIVAIWLPLLIVAYYALRLELRRRALSARIIELHLEPDYLRMYDFDALSKHCGGPQPLQNSPDNIQSIRNAFKKAFNNQFGGGNRILNYFIPFLLTLMSAILFALIIYAALTVKTLDAPYFKNGILPLAIGGALLYISPLYISRYASLALTPHELMGLLVRMWIAVILGVLVASLFPAELEPATAFFGGLLPVAAYEWLKDKIFPKKQETEETQRMKKLLRVLHLDEDLLQQMQNIGVRSVLELAYENPLRLFVETDLNLVVGIRTAIDIMTQARDTFKNADGTETTRFIDPSEDLPEFLKEPFANFAKAMKLENISTLRNTLQMMTDNPQLEYVRQMWKMVNRNVDQSTNPHGIY